MRLKQITENVADDPRINSKIDAALAAFDDAKQTQLLDALDALKMAGEAGLSPQEWAVNVKKLYPDEAIDLADLLKTAVKTFPFAVARIGDRRYGWREDALAAVDPNKAAAFKSQVRLAGETMKAAEELGEFTTAALAMKLHQQLGMDAMQAMAYVEHWVSQFLGGKIEKIGQDRYRIHVERPKSAEDHVQSLRDLINKVGKGDRID
mgnify:CR=1 FL=1